MHEVELGLNDQQQRSRRSNIEICGIPNDVSDESLEKNCIKIINEIVESPLNSTEINACHRLPGRGNKPIIMQFTGRKRRSDIIKNSRKARNINSTRLGLPEGNKIYINPNLSPYFKQIAFYCRRLRLENLISKVETDINDKIKIKMENHWHKISHINTLYDLFPDFEFGRL